MELNLNLPHVFSPGTSALDNACALRCLLDCMVDLNISYLKYHEVPSLYNSGVRYGRTTIWEPIPALYLPNKVQDFFNPVFWIPRGVNGGEKRGDCKSLGTARVAELRMKGVQAEPTFRWAKRGDGLGNLDFHILVQLANGDYEDPSRKLGMGSQEVQRFL